MNRRDRNRTEFAETGLIEVIDLFKHEFGAKVLGAVNDETGYAVGCDLGQRASEDNPRPKVKNR